MTEAQEILSLKRQLLEENLRRLAAEKQAAHASLAAIEMRLPMIDQEASLARAKLADLTKESDGH